MKLHSPSRRVILVASLMILFIFCVLVNAQIANAEEEFVKIGVPSAVSGPKALLGEYTKLGVTFAAEDINAKGGILGKKVKLIHADTESKVEVGVSAYEKLITREKVDFIVGEIDSSVALGTMDVVAKYGIPTIYVIPAADLIGEKVASNPDKFRNIFLTDPPTARMHDGAFFVIDEVSKGGKWRPKSKTVAFIIANESYPLNVAKIWRENLTKMGWEIVVDELVPFEATDFTSILTKVNSKKPALLKIELPSTPAGISITKQIHEFGIDKWALIVGGHSQKTVDFRRSIGMLAEGQLNLREPYPDWWAAYLKSKKPDLDPIQIMYGYDGMNIMAEAIRKAGSFDYKKVIDALIETDYNGVFMRTVFDPVTHFPKVGPQYKIYGIGQYMGGELKLIWPKEWAQSEFKAPF